MPRLKTLKCVGDLNGRCRPLALYLQHIVEHEADMKRKKISKIRR